MHTLVTVQSQQLTTHLWLSREKQVFTGESSNLYYLDRLSDWVVYVTLPILLMLWQIPPCSLLFQMEIKGGF